MQTLYDIAAPAKLNLFLHVTGRRADGFHLLQSVFMLIDWSDTLHFALRSDGQITREDLSWALPDDDLVLRAARALRQFSHCPLGAHIGVHKSIPAQAGMGGGSSDAASTLLALNRLWKLHLPLETLLHLGLRLGADVPFFLHGRHAWVEGIGEQITPITLQAARFAVVKPQAGLDTAKIFADPALPRNSKPVILTGFAANEFGFGQNDLQAVAERLCPDVKYALDWLGTYGLQARMTGSGSAVFAQVLHDVALPEPPAGWQLKLCSNLEVHPLFGWTSGEGLSVGSL